MTKKVIAFALSTMLFALFCRGAAAGEGTQDRLAPSAFPFRSRWRARVIPARVP